MIITLCGSARFERLFKAWNEALTLGGHTVFDLSVYPSEKAGVKQWYNDVEKIQLDAAHLAKIAASDAIVVINRYGYIGESTLREVMFAKAAGKKLYFQEGWMQGYGFDPDAERRVQDGDIVDEFEASAIKDGIALPVKSPINTGWYSTDVTGDTLLESCDQDGIYWKRVSDAINAE
jgi:hypothetical protein